MKLGQFSAGGPSRSGPMRGRFTRAPAPTVTPVMARQPGVYGGPPGSFITSQACPPGYSRIAMPRGPGQRREYRCVPRVAASVPAPSAPSQPVSAPVVSPTITVSPVMQQAFTPQFSPTLTMQQDSPGAAVTAAPIQAAAPEQAAMTPAPVAVPPPTAPSVPEEPSPVTTGPAMPQPWYPSAPSPGPPPVTMPAVAAPGGWSATDEQRAAVAAEAERGWGSMLPWLLAAGGIGLFLVTRKPKGKRS